MSFRFQDRSLYEALQALKEKRLRLERAQNFTGEYERVVKAYDELLAIYRALAKMTAGERRDIYKH